MTIEFNKLVEQVARMGKMIEKLDFDLRDRLALATRIFESCDDLDAVRERIQWVRQPEIRYRGAAPLETDDAEEINRVAPPPPSPSAAVILAVDGSQVYPNERALLHYYLLNIGMYVYHHGIDQKPVAVSQPDLVYHEKHVHDSSGAVIKKGTVDDRRTVAELRALAEEAWKRRRQDDPGALIAFYDNRLLYFPSSREYRGENLLNDYLAALIQLHDAGASLLGYVDNPYHSKRYMQLLFLMTLESADELKARQRELIRTGPLEGLHDQQFFDHILKPGERSAIMIQLSPQNRAFKARGESYEIAFFYLKVTNQRQALNSSERGFASRVVRVDIPLWVARDRKRVDAVHAMILAQCQLQGRNPYPYALTRADELAYVSPKDKEKLDQLVRLEVRKVKKLFLHPDAMDGKARGKELARGGKRSHEM